MALWVVRSGKLNAYETKFLDESRIYLTWDKLPDDLSDLEGLKEFLRVNEYEQKDHPDIREGAIPGYAGQIQAFANKMQVGDWVATSRKYGGIHIAEITGDFVRDPNAEKPFGYYRPVKWLAIDIPRSNFDQDILYSLGGASTIFQVKKNDAEARVRAMKENGWKATGIRPDDSDDLKDRDWEEITSNAIESAIIAKFKGHGLERLVQAILEAQGFETYHSPKGADGGIDILATAGKHGLAGPRVCVQVKSQDTAVDIEILRQLRGAMHTVGAERGLLVCWGGFKKTILNERQPFSDVRFWDRGDLIEQFLECYDNLAEDIRSAVPLKKIWAMSPTEESAD